MVFCSNCKHLRYIESLAGLKIAMCNLSKRNVTKHNFLDSRVYIEYSSCVGINTNNDCPKHEEKDSFLYKLKKRFNS